MANKSLGPDRRPIFEYSDEPPKKPDSTNEQEFDPLSTPASRAAAAEALPDISTIEGANEDPTLTKVVDRRWYERNKHIYPASMWQTFDPEKDYSKEIRRDAGGNPYFFSR